MPEYTVKWTIEVEADTPRDAAREAWASMRDWNSTANVFEVTHNGITVEVDLSCGPEDNLDRR